MSSQSDIETLITALTDIPEHTIALPPLYPLLAQEPPLTLRTILAHKQLLRDHGELARGELRDINKVIRACWQLPPTPLSTIPLGF